jgi:hypothetical protein
LREVGTEGILSLSLLTVKVRRAEIAARAANPRRALEVTANDRRFLRSLRIAADETPEEVE